MADTTHPPGTTSRTPRWDIFCRVIDNYGDVGVCWRLAADLAEHGVPVRLIIDDARALAWMAPAGHPQVQVLPWPAEDENLAPAGVVIEAFGCDPPVAYVNAMAQQTAAPPVWINLEYLSAEDFVERSHGLPSPQANGLTKWFFFPGFTHHTGGLLFERDLARRQTAFERSRWLGQQGLQLQPGERLASLFCYANPRLPGLLQALAAQPTLLLLTPGPAQAALNHAVPGLRMHPLPWLTQRSYDDLLLACDLNFVRGEDSLVRALWAGKPLVWQAYPQADGAHHAKVQALLARWQPGAEVARLWHWWNGGPQGAAEPAGAPPLPELQPWQHSVQSWRHRLLQQVPLAAQLQAFVHAKSGAQLAAPSKAAQRPPARI